MNQDVEKSPWKILACRQRKHTNTPIFSTIVFAAIVLLIAAGSIVSNASLKSTIHGTASNPEVITTKTITSHFLMNSNHKEDSIIDRYRPNPSAPLKNTTSKERMTWLRLHLPEFKVFMSTNLSEQFHDRVQKFFNDKCEVNFFMTWISRVDFFGRREFLAVESIFKAHPHGCLMIVSESMDSSQGESILKPFVDRGFKVTAATPDFPSLLRGTPAEVWFGEMKSCKRDPGSIPLSQNLSNLARLAVLYKYGGVYVDTDFIALKSFHGLKNSIGAQSIDANSKNWTRLNNAVLVFEKNHPLLYDFIEEFASTFDGNKWGHNGPYLVTRVVQRVRATIGNNFTLLPPSAFYPFNWIAIKSLFKMPKSPYDSRLLEAKLLKLNKQSYGLHLWNRITRKLSIEKGSAIDRIISNNCVTCNEIQI